MSAKPMFEHRHYKAIAATIAGLDFGLSDPITRRDIAEAFADALKGTNANFNRDRFIAAAMGTPSNGRDRVR
jgi:hypothetical protein